LYLLIGALFQSATHAMFRINFLSLLLAEINKTFFVKTTLHSSHMVTLGFDMEVDSSNDFSLNEDTLL
jgi:hypothetical protein